MTTKRHGFAILAALVASLATCGCVSRTAWRHNHLQGAELDARFKADDDACETEATPVLPRPIYWDPGAATFYESESGSALSAYGVSPSVLIAYMHSQSASTRSLAISRADRAAELAIEKDEAVHQHEYRQCMIQRGWQPEGRRYWLWDALQRPEREAAQ